MTIWWVDKLKSLPGRTLVRIHTSLINHKMGAINIRVTKTPKHFMPPKNIHKNYLLSFHSLSWTWIKISRTLKLWKVFTYFDTLLLFTTSISKFFLLKFLFEPNSTKRKIMLWCSIIPARKVAYMRRVPIVLWK